MTNEPNDPARATSEPSPAPEPDEFDKHVALKNAYAEYLRNVAKTEVTPVSFEEYIQAEPEYRDGAIYPRGKHPLPARAASEPSAAPDLEQWELDSLIEHYVNNANGTPFPEDNLPFVYITVKEAHDLHLLRLGVELEKHWVSDFDTHEHGRVTRISPYQEDVYSVWLTGQPFEIHVYAHYTLEIRPRTVTERMIYATYLKEQQRRYRLEEKTAAERDELARKLAAAVAARGEALRHLRAASITAKALLNGTVGMNLISEQIEDAIAAFDSAGEATS